MVKSGILTFGFCLSNTPKLIYIQHRNTHMAQVHVHPQTLVRLSNEDSYFIFYSASFAHKTLQAMAGSTILCSGSLIFPQQCSTLSDQGPATDSLACRVWSNSETTEGKRSNFKIIP